MYETMNSEIEQFENSISNKKLKETFQNCFYDTLKHSISYLDKDNVYIITGDIPAMWLRDSSASVVQYIGFAKDDEDVRKMLVGLLNRDYFYIGIDPYSNSFNLKPDFAGHKEDEGLRTPYTWERKFEIDSLCYPIWLQYKLYKSVGSKEVIPSSFIPTCRTILKVFSTEQRHSELSKYFHYRPGEKEEFCIPNRGKGGEDKYTGMIWSGYRPSDDACKYSYFIPGNMFAVVILKMMSEMLMDLSESELASEALRIGKEVEGGIRKYGIYHSDKFGDIYAYETDGNGNYTLMDDANVPSLLSIPYFGYESCNMPIYKNTRAYCLSESNPFFFKGEVLTGIGSPHTPKGFVWPMGMILQALTTDSDEEKKSILQMLLNSDDNTCLMHEGINKDNQKDYTRPWFTWCNSLFSYFLLSNKDLIK